MLLDALFSPIYNVLFCRNPPVINMYLNVSDVKGHSELEKLRGIIIHPWGHLLSDDPTAESWAQSLQLVLFMKLIFFSILHKFSGQHWLAHLGEFELAWKMFFQLAFQPW